jgi:hypothetical protein
MPVRCHHKHAPLPEGKNIECPALLVVHLSECYPTDMLHRFTHLLHRFPPLLTYFFLIIIYIVTIEDSIIFSPLVILNHKPKEMWKTPT